MLAIGVAAYRALMFWYFLRSKFENGVFYNYKAHKIARQYGVSCSAVSRYIKWNISKGFIKVEDGNLILINPAKVLGVKSKTIMVDALPWTSFKQVHFRFFGKMIKLNQDCQRWMGNIGSKINSENGFVAKRDYRKYQKIKGNLNGEAVLMPDRNVHNSTRQLSQLFKISNRTIANWLHELQKMGYAKVRELTAIVRGDPKYIPYYSWRITKGVYSGRIRVHYGSLITVNL